MDTIDQIDAVTEELGRLVGGVRADQLDAATPCAKWQVRDLLAHLVGGLHFFAGQLEGSSGADGDAPADLLGDDPEGAYRQAADHFRAAVRDPDAAGRTVSLGFGDLPGDAFMKLALFDLLVHSWDLATATNQDFEPHAEALAVADDFARGAIPPEARDGDVFAGEVEAGPDATPMERLAAFSGRRP